MLNTKTKDECQKTIEHMITRAEEYRSSFTDNNALLLSTMEDVRTVTKIAENLYSQLPEMMVRDYQHKTEEIEILGIALSCVLPKAYKDIYYLAMNPEMTLQLYKQGMYMVELIDEVLSLRTLPGTAFFFIQQYDKIKRRIST